MTALLFFVLASSFQLDESLQRHRNLGKAYYERGDYAQAAEELASVLSSDGAVARDYFNAGMAYLQNGEEERSLAAFTTARQMDPGMLEVDFGLGVLYKRQLRYPLALESLERVVARVPDDPCTWFNVGAVSSSMHREDEALAAFERVLAMGHARAENFYVSALFRSASILSRRGEKERAQDLFSEFQSLRDLTPNVSLTPSALENGRFGRVDLPLPSAAASPERPLALEMRERGSIAFRETACEGRGHPSLALGDFDGDGFLDVFVSSPCGASRLFRNRGDGRFTDETQAVGLDVSLAATEAHFLDLDNSDRLSLLVLGENGVRLFARRGDGFEDVTRASELPLAARSAAALDFDNDGQLDLLFSLDPAGIALYRNDGDGSFSDVSASMGLGFYAATRTGAIAVADFDENGFPDACTVAETGSAILLFNERSSRFRGMPVRLRASPERSSDLGMEIVDLHHDGWLDVALYDGVDLELLSNRAGHLETRAEPPDDRDPVRPGLLLGEVTGILPDNVLPRAVAIADLDGNGTVQLLLAGNDGRLRSWTSFPPRASWLRVELRGTRSNHQALGATIETKAGSFYQKLSYEGRPVTLFAGDRERLDVLRVSWTNGVIQNEVDVPLNRSTRIEESERQTSSCPFLYAWDGEWFRFLTDVVGRAPLGEIEPDGGIVQPNPEDYVRIPDSLLKPRKGAFSFQLTEELRELAFIDAVELLVVDHPGDVEVYANERFGQPPFEAFRLYEIRDPMTPAAAVDDQGRDVLAALSRSDGRHAPDISRARVPGFTKPHAIILTPPLDHPAGPLSVFLTGWVDWPSSSSMKALSTNEAWSPRPPSLEIEGQDGSWSTLSDDVGLPSGIGRTIAVDLGEIASDGRRIKVATNFAVRWDRAFFAVVEDGVVSRTHRVRARAADLHFRGFSRVLRDDPTGPERYDYDRLLAEPPWDAVAGRYTRYGDVADLAAERDGRIVAMAPGDEMTIQFPADDLPALQRGWKRSFLLHVTGWAKDQDANTRFSRSVEPLPVAGHEDDDRRTRRVPSLVSPLRP